MFRLEEVSSTEFSRILENFLLFVNLREISVWAKLTDELTEMSMKQMVYNLNNEDYKPFYLLLRRREVYLRDR